MGWDSDAKRHELPTTQVVQGWIFLNVLEWQNYGIGTSPIVVDEPCCGYADLSDAVVTEQGNKSGLSVPQARTVSSWWT